MARHGLFSTLFCAGRCNVLGSLTADRWRCWQNAGHVHEYEFLVDMSMERVDLAITLTWFPRFLLCRSIVFCHPGAVCVVIPLVLNPREGCSERHSMLCWALRRAILAQLKADLRY
eukprot:2802949-Rhodomonas_salina.2